MEEIFSKRPPAAAQTIGQTTPSSHYSAPLSQMAAIIHNPLEINPLTIAYSKLPMALRNRRFGRPSFHSHSQAEIVPGQQPQPIANPT
jgi:hypothetical protein